MERPLEIHMEEVFNEPGVSGVLCSDSQGLLLSSKGSVNVMHSGIFTAIAQKACELYPENGHIPVVSLEGENINLLIRSQDKIVFAIQKVKT